MNLAKYIPTAIIGFLLALPQFFPEIVKISFRVRTMLFVALIIVVLVTFTSAYWPKWLKKWVPFLTKIWTIFTGMTAKIIYVLLSSGVIIYTSAFNTKTLFLTVFIDLIYFSSISWFPIHKRSLYVEDYKDRLAKWIVVTGNLQLETDFGDPKPPDIILNKHESEATNTFIVHRELELDEGVIECDYYLEPNAILNILVYIDTKKHNWYMARYDSRDNELDSILIQDANQAGGHWRHASRGDKGNSKKRSWQHARVDFSKDAIKMYRDDELVATVNNPQMPGKRIGLFNEVGDVHIDNLKVTRL